MGKVIDYNCETKQETIREMTQEELELQNRLEADLATLEAEKAAKEAERSAVLAKLGLTIEEAKILLS